MMNTNYKALHFSHAQIFFIKIPKKLFYFKYSPDKQSMPSIIMLQ